MPEEQFDHVIERFVAEQWNAKYDLSLNDGAHHDGRTAAAAYQLGIEGAAEEFATWYSGDRVFSANKGYRAPLIAACFDTIASGSASASPGLDVVPVLPLDGLSKI